MEILESYSNIFCVLMMGYGEGEIVEKSFSQMGLFFKVKLKKIIQTTEFVIVIFRQTNWVFN